MLKHIILTNDFEAIGYALDFIDPERDLIRLDTAVAKIAINRTGTMAVIGAGTGLGIGIVPYNQELRLHTPFPSEGGHTDFTPYNLQELELVHYLQTNHMTKEGVHPELERVLSGAGLMAIYDYLNAKGPKSALSKRIAKLVGNDKIKLIADNWLSDPVCKKAVELFIRFYARAARTVVLLSEPFSGLFIAGGIAQKHPEWMKSNMFLDEFFRQDRRLDLLQNTPLYLITNPDIGLYGCCNVAINFSQQ
jgi:glucokinase